MEKIRKKYEDKVTFILLYQREAHPQQMNFKDIAQPKQYGEREHLAKRACNELHVASKIVIDGMDDAVRNSYGGLPNSAYFIDKGGKIVHKEAWAKPARWEEILDKMLKEGGE